MAAPEDLAGFADQLAALLVHAKSECTLEVGRFQFGKRNLTIKASPDSETTPKSGALVAAGNNEWEGYPLYLVNSPGSLSLDWTTLLELGAYGFVRDLRQWGWLATVEPDSGVLIAMHLASREAVCMGLRNLAPRHHAEFLRGLAHWHAIAAGNFLAHCGSVSKNGRAVLIFGRGGSGKTSLVLHCAQTGWRFLGDNVVEIQLNSDGMSAALVYPTIKLRQPLHTSTLNTPQEWDAENNKSIHFIGGSEIAMHPAEMVPVAYCALLSQDLGTDRRHLSRGEALLMTGPDTIAQFPGLESEVLGKVNEMTSGFLIEFLPRAPLDQLEQELALAVKGQR